MMYHEFLTLTGIQVPFDEYTNTIEPKYMKSKLDKYSFCKRYVNINTVLKKDILNRIIEDIKEVLGNKKYLNMEYKKLIKEQKSRVKEDTSYWYDLMENEEHWESLLPEHYQRYIFKERENLINRWHNEQTYHFIYRDGTQKIFTAEEILTGDVKNIKFTNIAYAHKQDSCEEIDTDTGELNYDISEDDQATAREEYFNQIEIKYQTDWGKKQSLAS